MLLTPKSLAAVQFWSPSCGQNIYVFSDIAELWYHAGVFIYMHVIIWVYYVVYLHLYVLHPKPTLCYIFMENGDGN